MTIAVQERAIRIGVEEVVSGNGSFWRIIGLSELFPGFNFPDIQGFCFNGISPEEFIKEKHYRAKLITLAVQLYGQERRKVTGHPYIKHPLRCLVLIDNIRKSYLEFGGLKEEDWQVTEAVALLHDVLEIKRKNREICTKEDLITELKELGFSEDVFNRIANLVEILTPEPKPADLSLDEWKKRKLEDLIRIFEKEQSLSDAESLSDADRWIFLVKVVDILANMEETLADLRAGLNQDTRMGRPLVARVGVFKQRINYVREFFPKNPYQARMEELLEILEEEMGCRNDNQGPPLSPHPRRPWMPNIPGHQQGRYRRRPPSKGELRNLKERTEKIIREILG